MKCNCSNWDDESPCEVHPNKLKRLPNVEHCCIVIRIYRASINKKYYGTIAKDAIRIFVTNDCDNKTEALNKTGQQLQNIKL